MDTYQTVPSLNILQKKEFEQGLKQLPYFRVCNQYGSIDWFGKTDISNTNLEEIISIKQNVIEVYPDKNSKP